MSLFEIRYFAISILLYGFWGTDVYAVLRKKIIILRTYVEGGQLWAKPFCPIQLR